MSSDLLFELARMRSQELIREAERGALAAQCREAAVGPHQGKLARLVSHARSAPAERGRRAFHFAPGRAPQLGAITGCWRLLNLRSRTDRGTRSPLARHPR